MLLKNLSVVVAELKDNKELTDAFQAYMAAVEEKNSTNHPISPAAHRSAAPNPISKSNYVETSSATTRDRNNNSLEKLDTESIEMPPTVDEDIDMNVNIVDSFIFLQSIAAKLSSTIIPDENDEGLIEVSSTAK